MVRRHSVSLARWVSWRRIIFALFPLIIVLSVLILEHMFRVIKPFMLKLITLRDIGREHEGLFWSYWSSYCGRVSLIGGSQFGEADSVFS